MRVIVLWTIIAALLIYGGFCWLLSANQRQIIYYPQMTRADTRETDFELKRDDGTVLRGWVVNPGMAAPILYFGGNAERIEANRHELAQMFPKRTIYLLAYRGYGASEGTPSEAALVGDAIGLYDHVKSLHPRSSICAIGRSLGSGVASQLAAKRSLASLVLVTPFDSMVATAKAHYPIMPVDWLLTERYESIVALHNYQLPVHIVYGGRDEVVPPKNTRRLIEVLNLQPARVTLIKEADHNDISVYPQYRRALIGALTFDHMRPAHASSLSPDH